MLVNISNITIEKYFSLIRFYTTLSRNFLVWKSLSHKISGYRIKAAGIKGITAQNTPDCH
jgi:hypothetical protein